MLQFFNQLITGNYIPPSPSEPYDPYNDTNELIGGSALGSYTEESFTYSSSIDSISNLYGKVSFDAGYTNQPIVFLLHGWNGDGDTITYAQMQQYAVYGFFVVTLGLRGRNSADGSRDASGRELYDLIDSINYIKSNYSTYVSTKKVSLIGFSGGGGNTLGLISKAPDLFNVAAAYFPMSDYYYDDTESWGVTNSGYLSGIISSVGESNYLTDSYLARVTYNAISNYLLGQMYLFHDPGDSVVDVINTEKCVAHLLTTDLSNYIYDYPTTLGHGDFKNYRISDIAASIISAPSWNLGSSGTCKIRGYMKTKLFEIWLNSGLDASATLAYDIVNKTFTITPEWGADSLNPNIDVEIIFNGVTRNETINSQAIITF